MDGYLDGTLGSDPVHQDRPHHGLDLSTLDCAVLIPKPIVRMIPRATKHGGRPRALQAHLAHKNIQHTVRYTELSPTRFKDFWRE